MTIFWIMVAGLAGLALLFAIAPLLRSGSETASDSDDAEVDRVNLGVFKQQLSELDADLTAGKLDKSQYDAARKDLERELLRDVSGVRAAKGSAIKLPGSVITSLALLIVIPLSALGLYEVIGTQEIIPQLEAGAGAQGMAGHGGGGGMPELDVLVQRLEERLAQAPDDAEGWTMLGRTYFAMQQPGKAQQALAKAHELNPDDTKLMLAYAESIAANNDNSLEGRPSELIAEALKREPDNINARWLTGMAAFQRGQFNAARTAWTVVLEQLDPAGEDAAQLRELIAEAEQRAAIPADQRLAAAGTPAGGSAQTEAPAAAATTAPAAEQAEESAPAAGEAAIDVNVSLAPELAERAPADATVFVYAKAAAGPPMPLAVQRVTVSDLPATLRLDDSMAMMPAMRLSAFPQVIVGARVSASGQATPQPGDLEGESDPVASAGTATVAVRIDSVRP